MWNLAALETVKWSKTMATGSTRVAQAIGLKPTLEPSRLGQLLSEQDRGAELSKQRIEQWTKFKDDYVSLKCRLETIADKVSHDVMVPFGKLALIPGTLKHTNEILVLLGDNWFVQRSARQSVEIVDRRIEQCRDMLNGLKKELDLYHGWKQHTSSIYKELTDLNQGIEILEPEEEGWREKHREKVREHKKKLAELRRKEPTEIKTEEDLWRRLDELELEEDLQQELDMMEGGSEQEVSSEGEEEVVEEETIVECDEETPHPDNILEQESTCVKSELPSTERKRVTWSESDSVRQFNNDDILNDIDHNNDILRVTFKHSAPNKKAKIAEEKLINNGKSDVCSPAEIFERYYGNYSESGEPKSILKIKKCPTFANETVNEGDKESVETVTAMTQPFSDEVVEREPVQSEANELVNTHRPVSRFRAARMARKL